MVTIKTHQIWKRKNDDSDHKILISYCVNKDIVQYYTIDHQHCYMTMATPKTFIDRYDLIKDSEHDYSSFVEIHNHGGINYEVIPMEKIDGAHNPLMKPLVELKELMNEYGVEHTTDLPKN